MSETIHEKVSEKTAGAIRKDAKEAGQKVVRELVEGFEKRGFRKEDVIKPIQEGVEQGAKEASK